MQHDCGFSLSLSLHWFACNIFIIESISVTTIKFYLLLIVRSIAFEAQYCRSIRRMRKKSAVMLLLFCVWHHFEYALHTITNFWFVSKRERKRKWERECVRACAHARQRKEESKQKWACVNASASVRVEFSFCLLFAFYCSAKCIQIFHIFDGIYHVNRRDCL